MHLLFQHQSTFCSKKLKQLLPPYFYFLNCTFLPAVPPRASLQHPSALWADCSFLQARSGWLMPARAALSSSEDLPHDLGQHQPGGLTKPFPEGELKQKSAFAAFFDHGRLSDCTNHWFHPPFNYYNAKHRVPPTHLLDLLSSFHFFLLAPLPFSCTPRSVFHTGPQSLQLVLPFQGTLIYREAFSTRCSCAKRMENYKYREIKSIFHV